MNTIQLFCIPYAGGSASVFHPWTNLMMDGIQLIPIELSGRGRRYGQGFYPTIHEAAEDVLEQILPHMGGPMGSPYALWGHSMGAVIAFELCHLIQQREYSVPSHLFCSGSSAPAHRKKDRMLHLLPDNEFLEELKKLEGTPQVFFENKDLIELYLPILRSDFRIIDEYVYKEKSRKLACDLSVMYGSREDFKNEVHAWEEYTLRNCRIHEIQGGHFFLFDLVQEVAGIINQALQNYVPSKPVYSRNRTSER